MRSGSAQRHVLAVKRIGNGRAFLFNLEQEFVQSLGYRLARASRPQQRQQGVRDQLLRDMRFAVRRHALDRRRQALRTEARRTWKVRIEEQDLDDSIDPDRVAVQLTKGL